ncbi:hypothetical protein TKK_0000162 [Trichogramma kaykai]
MEVHQTDQSMTTFFKHVFNCIMSTAYHFKHYFLEDFNIELIKSMACLQPKNATSQEYIHYKFQIESDDVINFWAYISSMKNEASDGKFEKVATFALYVLAIPHGNMFPEHMNDRKTKTTNRLSMDTLNGRIMTAQAVKLFKTSSFEPMEEMKKKAARGRFHNYKYREL